MSAPKRFFTRNLNFPEESEIVLDGEEFVHAKTVLRITEGTEITLLGGDGNEYSAIVTKVNKHSLSAHITGVSRGEREPLTKIYLLIGALKGDKTELVVQKATELGVSGIGVFRSRYCSAYVNENKLERLNKVAKEAAKQCLRSTAPDVVYFDDFAAALQSAEGFENKLFFCEFANESQADLSALSGSTALVVGSEGGFCEDEFAAAKNCDFAGMSLGKRILRAETAAISVCALAAYALGELK